MKERRPPGWQPVRAVHEVIQIQSEAASGWASGGRLQSSELNPGLEVLFLLTEWASL